MSTSGGKNKKCPKNSKKMRFEPFLQRKSANLGVFILGSDFQEKSQFYGRIPENGPTQVHNFTLCQKKCKMSIIFSKNCVFC